MRRHGLVDLPGDLGLDGHACWGYQDASGDFRDAAVAFLSEGLRLGQRLMFVGGAEAEKSLRTLEPTRSMIAEGSLVMAPFDQVYPGGRRLPNDEQWAMYSAVTDQAMADGFTGLCVLAEVTSLVAAGQAWEDHAGWEEYADRRMANGTLSALCCFDRTELQPQALAAIASAHPVADRRLEDLVPFRLFGRGETLALAGEVDAFSSGRLGRLLRAETGDAERVVLDLSALRFIDHTGLRVIQDHTQSLIEAGRALVVRGEPASYRRLAQLLERCR